MVRSIERGDYYATTGVTLKTVRFEKNVLSIEIDAKPEVTYTTQFIGTLRGWNQAKGVSTTQPTVGNDEVGQVLSEQAGERATYALTGDELYVRAKIISDKAHPNPFATGDVEVAWTQPVRPMSEPAPAR